ncbi:helix-turn-helix transcriptional regulator [Micromonospora sp. NPDC006766]|uniref:helix-turn-helix transcriptional regulator n=1 Tax=Micromonospora sp. NPDC006766 TaxID=3154778 RepID=UPI0033E74860
MGTLSPHEERFAANVAQVRRARGMSQEDLANQIGMGRTAVVAIEAGGRRIRLGEACQIADVLGVSLAELIGDQPITIQLPASTIGAGTA